MVKRNRTAPIWSHPLLKPLPSSQNVTETVDEVLYREEGDVASDGRAEEDEEEEEEEEEEVDVVTASHLTHDEQMNGLIRDLRSFADGLAYQIQFRDNRMLSAVYRNGSGFIRMMEACLEKERRDNLNRGMPTATWDSEFASATYYRTWPRNFDRDT
ncbi:hypothetical protein D9757_012146 [Collybiopsis confluens]|uniref:Uncharacterized protein n=1 Tax=Collybiopsis confluens TaxID=2823264 RepID=A0A8H5G7S5_9AGAR|nr:hypothetical protein D9757_012146 [Collybiopsis confluens]